MDQPAFSGWPARSGRSTGRRRLALLAAALLLSAPPSRGLDPDQTFWNAGVAYVGWDEGMADSVTDVAQDRAGFLWATTHQGLVRFDGDEPRSYDVSEHPQLLSNRLERLLVDRNDELYVISAKGVSRFDRERFRTVADRTSLAGSPIALAQDAAGQIWIATASRLFVLGAEPVAVAIDSNLPRPITALAALDGNLWVGGSGGFAVRTDSRWRTFTLPGESRAAKVRAFCLFRGQVWIATDHGAFTFDGTTVTERLADHAGGEDLRALLADRDGNLWLAGRSKLIRRYPDGRIETPDLGLGNFGLEPFIHRIFEDREGALWFASSTFSLLKVRNAIGRRITFQQGLKSVVVAAVASDSQGQMRVGTEDGVYAIAGGRAEPAIAGIDLPHPSVLTLHFDRHDRLWIGTNGGVAFLEDGRDATPVAVEALAGTPVFAILDAGAETWIGTGAGLYRWREGALIRVDGLGAREVRSLLPAPAGGVWAGTRDGLFEYRDGLVTQAGVETLLENAVVTALTALPDGSVVAVSQDNGLFIRQADRWRQLSRADGVPINGASFATAADGSNLWVAGSEGIYRIALEELDDPDRESVAARVLAYSGKMIRGADYVDCCRGRGDSNGVYQSGRLWLPTKDGVFILPTNAKPPWKLTAPVFLRALEYGTTRLEDPNLERLTLGPNQRDLHLELDALALTAHVDVRFRYRLEGHDSQWIDGGRGGIAHYTNLKPGRYRFLAQAGLDRNIWGETLSLEIVRQPRVFETVWFRTTLAAATVLAVAALLWLRLVLLRRKEDRIARAIEQRTADLNALNLELSEKNLQLLEASHTDPLTGLLNRRFLLPALEQRDEPIPGELAARLARRTAILLLDMDDFKAVNDRLGHLAGDEVLRHLARLLTTLTRADDFVIRWGGEEFLLVCAQAQRDLSHLAERIRAGIAGHEFVLRSGHRLTMTCSLGAVSCPLWGQAPDPVSWTAYLAAADRALLAVKRHGRDGWVCLSAGSRAPTSEQVGWLETRLKRLIDSGVVTWTASRDEIRLGERTARIKRREA